jgi:hypothetical protein
MKDADWAGPQLIPRQALLSDRADCPAPAGFFSVPSMIDSLEVKVHHLAWAAQQQPRAHHRSPKRRPRLARSCVPRDHKGSLIHRTAVYGPVCTVVWEGEAARPTPIPIQAAAASDWSLRAVYPAPIVIPTYSASSRAIAPSTRLTLVTAWDTTTRPPSVRQSRFLRGGHDKGSRYQNAPPATADGAKNFSV